MKPTLRVLVVASATIAGCLLAPLQATSLPGGTPAAPRADPSRVDADPGPSPVPGEANVTVTDDGWVKYASALEDSGIRGDREVVAGTRGPDGQCTLSGVDKGSSSDVTVVREEVAFNPATCATVYAVARLTPKQADKYLKEADGSTESRAGATNGKAVAAAAATKYNRHLRTAWVDPIEIDISSQRVALR